MKNLCRVAVAGMVAGFLIGSSAGWAAPLPHPEGQHEEDRIEHKPMHGGFFGDAGDLYHYELVVEQPEHLKLYLYDEKVKPLKVDGLPARWTLLGDDSTAQETGRFAASRDGEFFWTTFRKPASEILHILVEVEKKNVWVPMEFYVPVSQHGLAALTGKS